MWDKILDKNILVPIITVIVAIIIYLILSKLIKRIFKRRTKLDIRRQKTISSLLNNALKIIIFVIAGTIVLNSFGINTTALVTSIGVIGIVVGLSLQDILKDIIAGVSAMVEDQYAVGDIIAIGTFKGEVMSLGIRTTRIKAYTGETQIISNRTITNVINYSLEESRAIVDVAVAYESDLVKVEKILTEVCEKINKQNKNLKSELVLVGIDKLLGNAIQYRIMGKAEPRENTRIEREAKHEIVEKLLKAKIEIRGGS